MAKEEPFLKRALNVIQGGVSVYRIEDGRFIPLFYSDGDTPLSGEGENGIRLEQQDVFAMLCGQEKERVLEAAYTAYERRERLDVSCQVHRLDQSPAWLHLNGQRGGEDCSSEFYIVYTVISEEMRQKELESRREKERLEQYFETVLKHLPGGVAVVRYESVGCMTPEFMSEGFAAMTGMTLSEAWALYQKDAMAGVHPGDREDVNARMAAYVAGNERNCEIEYRLKRGDGSYFWVRNSLTMIEDHWGVKRVYSVYQDLTKEIEEKAQLRQKYRDLILQHHHTQDPSVLIVGHCNITQNRILEIIDHTGLDPLRRFGSVREEFFTGLGSLIVDEGERKKFCGIYLNRPSLEAYERGDYEHRLECFVQLPNEKTGRYVLITMNLVATPDSGDVTGILSIADITGQIVSDRILHRLSVSGYDFVADLDLLNDQYRILTSSNQASCLPPQQGSHSAWVLKMQDLNRVVPRDQERYRRNLSADYIMSELQKKESYTFSFSILDENEAIRTKSMTISAADLRLQRVCLARADITESVREQQGLLRLIAHTFELAGFVKLTDKSLTLYTQKTVLENLPPAYYESYEEALRLLQKEGGSGEIKEEVLDKLRIESMLKVLEEKPEGCDFLISYRTERGECHKQITVMWSDMNHTTLCLVQADVTDTLAAERKTKKALENALILAEEANRAKSDFLSAMSHDIRTPMNAIMGMTTLAFAHLGDEERVRDCLEKISVSSRHLLSLINDILDMSKIERSQITLNRMRISFTDLLSQLSAIMAPQAKSAGLHFTMREKSVVHRYFYGDSLRISQIFINILSNAVKYTPEGGSVDFLAEEIPAVKCADWVRYRFTVSDTGVGMTEEFLSHVFEPFTRSADVQQMEGTGLGLSITSGLVHLMGGDIRVESRVHQGTRFEVELECEPAVYEEQGKEAKDNVPNCSKSGQRPFDGRTFLVVEDNRINAEILCELLAMQGARTVVRTDGRQGVLAFAGSVPGAYDAILMDVRMPEMNGYEATRKIRGLNRSDARSIPIIAMTANAFAEDIRAAEEAGMNGHVAKPIDMALLRETLERVLTAPEN